MPLDRVWFLASSALNRVYNFMRTCPRQGLNLSLTGYVFFNRSKKSCLKSRFQKSFNCNIIANKTLQNCVKQGSVYFLLRPEQGLKIEGGVQHRVYILGLFCPTQGQGLKPSAAPLYPTIGQVPPPPREEHPRLHLFHWCYCPYCRWSQSHTLTAGHQLNWAPQ